MTALVLYAADKYLKGDKKRAVVEAARSSLCEGMHLNKEDVTVMLEAYKEGESNERVTHCLFPVLYTPEGTPYAYKKRAGQLMNERLRALFDEEEICHVYFHMKEHGCDNVAVDGTLLKHNEKAMKHLDESRGVNSTPWLD